MSARGEPDCELTDEPGTPARAPARPPTARAASQPPPHRLLSQSQPPPEPEPNQSRRQRRRQGSASPRQQSVTASITRQPDNITVGLQYVATRSHAKQNKPLADRDAKSARLHTRLANLAHSCHANTVASSWRCATSARQPTLSLYPAWSSGCCCREVSLAISARAPAVHSAAARAACNRKRRLKLDRSECEAR